MLLRTISANIGEAPPFPMPEASASQLQLRRSERLFYSAEDALADIQQFHNAKLRAFFGLAAIYFAMGRDIELAAATLGLNVLSNLLAVIVAGEGLTETAKQRTLLSVALTGTGSLNMMFAKELAGAIASSVCSLAMLIFALPHLADNPTWITLSGIATFLLVGTWNAAFLISEAREAGVPKRNNPAIVIQALFTVGLAMALGQASTTAFVFGLGVIRRGLVAMTLIYNDNAALRLEMMRALNITRSTDFRRLIHQEGAGMEIDRIFADAKRRQLFMDRYADTLKPGVERRHDDLVVMALCNTPHISRPVLTGLTGIGTHRYNGLEDQQIEVFVDFFLRRHKVESRHPRGLWKKIKGENLFKPQWMQLAYKRERRFLLTGMMNRVAQESELRRRLLQIDIELASNRSDSNADLQQLKDQHWLINRRLKFIGKMKEVLSIYQEIFTPYERFAMVLCSFDGTPDDLRNMDLVIALLKGEPRAESGNLWVTSCAYEIFRQAKNFCIDSTPEKLQAAITAWELHYFNTGRIESITPLSMDVLLTPSK